MVVMGAQAFGNKMSSKDGRQTGTRSENPAMILPVLLTPKEAARSLKLSDSWLAKARMRGDGPPYILIGRSVRYAEAALIQWMKSRQRLSTSEQ
jgi:predicted DNA-binding transcriptional regulator AlpA